MHDIDPEASAPAHAALPAELPPTPAATVQRHPVRREIARDLPDWDLLPPSSVITVRRLVR
jgi:hypothetical protein